MDISVPFICIFWLIHGEQELRSRTRLISSSRSFSSSILQTDDGHMSSHNYGGPKLPPRPPVGGPRPPNRPPPPSNNESSSYASGNKFGGPKPPSHPPPPSNNGGSSSYTGNKGGNEYQCEAMIIDYLLSGNVQLENQLFHTTSGAEAKQLLVALRSQGTFAASQLSKYNSKVIAGAFKNYLKDKPPLLGFENYDLLEATHNGGGNPGGYGKIIKKLAPNKRGILAYLFHLLGKLVKEGNMEPSFIGHVFGPILMRPLRQPIDMAKLISQPKMQKGVVTSLVVNAHTVFGGKKSPGPPIDRKNRWDVVPPYIVLTLLKHVHLLTMQLCFLMELYTTTNMAFVLGFGNYLN
eukprot:jgi/Bigna1/82253/fgenesh1_pg.89_\